MEGGNSTHDEPTVASLYLRALAQPLEMLAVRASLYGLCCWCYKLWARKTGKQIAIPAFLAEVYQLGWLLFLAILVFTTPYSGVGWWLVIGAATYRALDLFVYALYLVLFGKVIVSAERSLLLLVGNLVEVILCSAILLLNLDCIQSSSKYDALYSGLRTLATIGPSSNVQETGFCRLVIAGQIGIDCVLVIIALALIVATLKVQIQPRR